MGKWGVGYYVFSQQGMKNMILDEGRSRKLQEQHLGLLLLSTVSSPYSGPLLEY